MSGTRGPRPASNGMNELNWEIYEYEHRQNETEWFWALGIVVVSISVASFIYGNVLLGIFILLAGFMMGTYARKGPPLLRVEATKKGISVNGRFLPYKELASFSIDRDKIVLEEKEWWRQLFIIPMHLEDIESVHLFLKEHLPEKNHKEPLSHQIMERLGF
mgnify:CR=1 FL=1